MHFESTHLGTPKTVSGHARTTKQISIDGQINETYNLGLQGSIKKKGSGNSDIKSNCNSQSNDTIRCNY